MKAYTKTYMDYFGYGIEDFIPCEICGERAVDIMHIIPQSKFGKKRKLDRDDIKNLMAGCRGCHIDYDHHKKWTSEEITQIHLNFMQKLT